MAGKCFDVFPHSVDGKPTGRGYVPREIDCSTGRPLDTRNYGDVGRVGRVFKIRSAADRAAEEKTRQVETDERIFRSHQ